MHPSGLQIVYVTDQEIAAVYIGAVTFSSIVLRFLLSVSGLLRRASQGVIADTVPCLFCQPRAHSEHTRA
jgi:hypothetical protein